MLEARKLFVDANNKLEIRYQRIHKQKEEVQIVIN
jgi:hypothetical protein